MGSRHGRVAAPHYAGGIFILGERQFYLFSALASSGEGWILQCHFWSACYQWHLGHFFPCPRLYAIGRILWRWFSHFQTPLQMKNKLCELRTAKDWSQADL